MKIIQVITLGHELYGAQRHVFDLCESLKEEGHEVILMTGSPGRLNKYAQTIGIKSIQLHHLTHSINPYHDLLGIIELIRYFRKMKPDVVASHSSKAGILVRIAAWYLGIPNTFTAHGWSFADGNSFKSRKVYQLIEKVIGWISCKVIVISEADRQYALKLNVIDDKKMKLIYHGIKPPPVTEMPSNTNKNCFTMVMSARFQTQKDHDTLIEALIPLKELSWRLFLLGDGELLTETKDKVTRLGLEGKVYFEGKVDNVQDYLQMADVFLLITKWEGLPISILEAMAYGLPIIATDVAGIKEEVWHGQNGFLVQRKAITEVTKAILTFYTDKVLRKAMGKKSKEIFNLRFRRELMIKNTIELYKEIKIKEKTS